MITAILAFAAGYFTHKYKNFLLFKFHQITGKL